MRLQAEREETMGLAVQENKPRQKRRYRSRTHSIGDIYGRRRIVDWFDVKDRPAGPNRIGLEFFRELKEIDKMFARNNTILFFLISRYGMNDMRKMMVSNLSIRSLMYKIRMQIKGDAEHEGHAITQEWIPIFRRDVDAFRRRAEYVFFIVQADLKETELYPYFEAVGFERLLDFGIMYRGGDDEQAEQLEKEIDEWNESHCEEVEAYMDSISEQIRNRDEHRRKVKEAASEEKAAERRKRKEATEEAKEIRRNNEAYAKRVRRIERSFQRYYK